MIGYTPHTFNLANILLLKFTWTDARPSPRAAHAQVYLSLSAAEAEETHFTCFNLTEEETIATTIFSIL